MKPVPRHKADSAATLRNRIFLAFAIMSLLALGLLTTILYGLFRNGLRDDIRQRLRDIVSLAAIQIDAKEHDVLSAPEDEGNAAYLRLRESLQEIRDSATEIRFVYTMRQGPNKEILFVVDAETNPQDIAHLGESYDDAGPALSRTFSSLSHPIVEDAFYTDKFGTWLSGYAPFYGDGAKRAGVIGVDIAASKVLKHERHFLLAAIAVFGAVVPFLLLAAWWISRSLTHTVMKAQEALVRRSDFERLISEISSDLVGLRPDALDAGIERALASIGAFTAAGRAYVFQFKDGLARIDNTHEWCAEGIAPQIDTLKSIPLAEDLPWLAERIMNREVIHVPNVRALPPEARLERAHFEAQSIQSLIVVPMASADVAFGFLGFDSVRGLRTWTSQDQNLLTLVAETITHALNRRRGEERLAQARRNFEAFFDTVDQFLFVLNGSGRIVRVNKAVVQRLGYPETELQGEEVLAVHPSDYHEEALRLIDAMLAGEAEYCSVPLMAKDGQLIDVETRVIHGEWDGKPAFFGVSKDVSSLKRSEEIFSKAFHASAALMAISTIREGRFIDVNEAFLTTLGYGREEVVGHTSAELSVFVDSEQRAAIRRAAEESVRGLIRDVAVQVRTRDGAIREGLFALDTITIGQEPCWLTVMTDITERKRAEEALRESENRFRRLMDHARDMIYRMSIPDGEYEYVSPASADIFGYAPEVFLSSPLLIQDSIHPEWRGYFTEQWDALVKGEMPPFYEYQIVHGQSGETRWLHQRNMLIRDDAGAPVAIEGIVTDITERKRGEEALREAREFLEAAVAQSPSGILIADAPDVRIRVANRAAFGIRGGDQSILTGIDVAQHTSNWQLFRPDGSAYPPEQLPLSRAVLRGEVTRNEEMIIRDQDGSDHWVSTNAAPIRDAQGKTIAGIVIFHDVTERRRAEEGLRESEERLAQVAAVTTDLIYEWDVEHDTLEWFGDLDQVLGYEVGGLERTIKGWAALIHPEDAEGLQDAVERHRRSTQPITETYRVRRKDGTWAWWEDRGIPILGARGAPTRWVGSCTDISQRKEAEEERLSLERQVRHAQKLESLGVLAGGIAHDFNNLLMAILGNADLALDKLSPHAPARGNIQEIEKASRRAAELAKQMLAYSGKGRFVIEPIDLNGFVQEMAHLLEVSSSKRAVLQYDFAEELPRFDGDATQIRQVIMNLITNASEAIGDKSGVIALSTGAIECDRAYLDGVSEILQVGLDEPLPEGPYTYLEVSDTGCGMDAATIENVFDPFFTTKFTGRGLGMAAVLGIVRGHKGAIKIYSELEKGTTFKVLFPVANAPGSPAPQQASSEGQAGSWRGQGTVLIVDDEETVCDVGGQMLERMGFQVLCAPSGREALDAFREHGPEIVCVLLDLTMPHMDGEETFRELRRIHPGVPVILCSGYNEQDATQRFAGKGLAGFLQKPYTIAALRGKLSEVLPRGQDEE